MKIYNDDNRTVMHRLLEYGQQFDLIYADMIYENYEFGWAVYCWNLLKPNGVFIVQTDWHTVAEMKKFLDSLFGSPDRMINWCIYINDWGGTPKKGFPKKHDDILIYAKSDDWKWDKTAIEIPKVTAGTKFDKKGTGMKTPCDVFYDHASFSTMAKERVKTEDGHNIKWQKPEWLMDRLVRPFTTEGDSVLDVFMGSGSLGKWCIKNNRQYTGIELDTDVFNIAKNGLENLKCEDMTQLKLQL